MTPMRSSGNISEEPSQFIITDTEHQKFHNSQSQIHKSKWDKLYIKASISPIPNPDHTLCKILSKAWSCFFGWCWCWWSAYIRLVVALVLAVGSNKLDFYFPHNGPRGPTNTHPPARPQAESLQHFLVVHYLSVFSQFLRFLSTYFDTWGQTAPTRTAAVKSAEYFVLVHNSIVNTFQLVETFPPTFI